MAKLSAHGNEIMRWLSARGTLRVIMEDGAVLYRSPFHGWKIYGKVKEDRTPQQVAENIRRKLIEAGQGWRLKVRSIPSFRRLQQWDMDGVCEALDGCRVEPDGECPHGQPSWLRALGMI